MEQINEMKNKCFCNNTSNFHTSINRNNPPQYGIERPYRYDNNRDLNFKNINESNNISINSNNNNSILNDILLKLGMEK